MSSKRKGPSRQTARKRLHKGKTYSSNYNIKRKSANSTPKVKAFFQYVKPSKVDHQWFEGHPGRQYRIRPTFHDEPGDGFVIVKQMYPSCCARVGVGPEGAWLADTDELLGKVYDMLRSGKMALFYPLVGTVVEGREL